MNFFEKQFANDIVDLQKNGVVVEKGFKANVQKEKITIYRCDIKVEEGDFIIRHLPNGLTEKYIVLDRGFNAGVKNVIPPYYQCSVKKEINLNSN